MKTVTSLVSLKIKYAFIAVALFSLLPGLLPGQTFTNGGFENGDLGGCWSIGGVGDVEVVQASNFTPNIMPTEGSFMVLLGTGPSDPAGAVGDLDGNGIDEFNPSNLTVTLTVSSAPTMLCFDWAFLTNEQDQPFNFDDIIIVTLNGVQVLTRSVNKPGGASPFMDTLAYDGVVYTVTTTGVLNGQAFDGRTVFSNFCTPINTNGNHTLDFQVVDQGDNAFNSGLLIDNITVDADCLDLSITQITDSAGSNIEQKNGGFVVSFQTNDSVAASNNGQVLAFTSTGNYTGDNPNLNNQIFVAQGGGFERITASVGGHVANPALTSNGRFLAFEWDGDPLGTNGDGNIEVFRFDRNNDTFVQVTDTTGCSNTQASVSNNSQGRRIAFLSDCAELTPGDGFNPDGNPEIVLWDANSGNYLFNGTSGCINGQPVIATHNGGRYVSFISSCDYTGANADGNNEVFQWDRNGNNISQITNSLAGSGHVNDTVSCSNNGQFVAFLSNADYTGQNPNGDMVVFRWNRSGNSLSQVTTANALHIYTGVAIDDSGNNLSYERLNLGTFDLEVFHHDIGTGVQTFITDNNASLTAVGLSGGVANVSFQSSGNSSGNNGDGNVEIWRAIVD